MKTRDRDVVALFVLCVSCLSLTSAHSFDGRHYPARHVITRDVCIIGGGASGTYAAVRLHDMGKSVVVVERSDYLGGHTQTYVDPATKTPIDIGVVNWYNIEVVRNYFARLNVSYFSSNASTSGFSPGNSYVDFSTGKVLSSFSPPDATAALGGFVAQLQKYPYLGNGFDLPSPVPEDLLLPFGEFVTKYALEDLVFLIGFYSQGVGNILSVPTIYVLKLIGLDFFNTLGIGLIYTVSGDNSEVYRKAHDILGADVLLRTVVVATDRDRSHGYVKVLVRTSKGGTKLIRAKKIIISIPPKLCNLMGFDLSPQEAALFGQFENTGYYTGLLLNAGVNGSSPVFNVGENTSFNLPVLPGPAVIYPAPVPNLTHVFYSSAHHLSEDEVKADIIAKVLELRQLQNQTTTTTAPSFAILSSHVPFYMKVPVSAIAGGFYRELYALQGQRHTYYTGAAFHTQDSALLWRFTEKLLATIVA